VPHFARLCDGTREEENTIYEIYSAVKGKVYALGRGTGQILLSVGSIDQKCLGWSSFQLLKALTFSCYKRPSRANLQRMRFGSWGWLLNWCNDWTPRGIYATRWPPLTISLSQLPIYLRGSVGVFVWGVYGAKEREHLRPDHDQSLPGITGDRAPLLCCSWWEGSCLLRESAIDGCWRVCLCAWMRVFHPLLLYTLLYSFSYRKYIWRLLSDSTDS